MFESGHIYALAADLVLLVHFSFVAFVVLGFVVIWIGHVRGWGFVRGFWFRLTHVAAMAVVLAQAWLGRICPLTLWEQELRTRAQQRHVYDGTFMQHWLHRILFFELAPRVFAAVYTLFFLLICITFAVVPPRWPGRGARSGQGSK